MLFEIVLYVQHRTSGRVLVGDGEIIAVVENGRRRTPKTRSFNDVIKHIMKTDLVPVGQPVQIGRKSIYATYRHTYRKPGVYVQSRHDKWAVAYPVEDHWKVKKVGKETETRYETAQQAHRAVNDWCGTVPDLMELRREGMVGKRDEYLSAEQVLACRDKGE